MDVCLLIKRRLAEMGAEQRELAAAAEVTESYISQLLTRKKLPPAPERTDIYAKMAKFLNLPSRKIAKLVEHQRQEALQKTLAGPPAPLFKEVRELVLRKCAPEKEKQVRAVFEKQPFGEIERLVTQKLSDVVKALAKEELGNERWLRLVAQLIGRSYEEMRVMILEFLDTDVFHLSVAHCDSFLDPLIESWDVDLDTFAMEIILNRRLVPSPARKFEFVESVSERTLAEQPGLDEFLRDPSLSGGATRQEIEFLTRLRPEGKQPTPLYYYREWQNLRDPLHFQKPAAPPSQTKRLRESQPHGSIAPMHRHRDAKGIEKQLQTASRENATRRWTKNGNHDAKQKANP